MRFVPSGAGNIALALAGVALCVCLYLLFGHQSDKPSGARQFTFARLGGWIALALSIITPLTIWVTLREEMGFHLLPDSFTAMLLSIVKMGGDDFALLLAFFALGTYCFLQLKSTLLRERINHRRFANAYAQLRQATSVSPEAADLNVARPLTDARKAALRGDSAAVERFVRDVNRLLASETGDWSVMTAYTIAKSVERQDARLFSSEKLSSEDFDAIVRDLSGYGGSMFRARKISFVSARKAAAIEPIETRYDGKESNDTAQPGDWIVTNMNTKRDIIRDSQGHLNTYVIRAADFVRLYSRDVGDNEFGEIYKAKGIVDAVHLPGGFDIVAPWGERQQGASGYLLRNGADVYGIYAKAYDETYEKV